METKFRAWVTVNSDENEMVYAYCYLNPVSNHFYAVDTTNERPDIGETLAVMQFMNFKDKNGTDVYFDDIVKDSFGRIMKVGYHNHRFCFVAITETNFIYADFFNWIENDLIQFEVIGNIHANPELLTKK